MKMRLQSVLEEDVTVSIDQTSLLRGAESIPVCKLRIDDSSDGEHVGLIASLTVHEARALGAAMTRWADQQDERATHGVQLMTSQAYRDKIDAMLLGLPAPGGRRAPQPQEDVTPMAGQDGTGPTGQA